MAVFYIRIDDDVDEWVRAEAERAGMSLARAVNALLAEARDRGWQLGGRVRVPDRG